jgi:hypothetical protein
MDVKVSDERSKLLDAAVATQAAPLPDFVQAIRAQDPPDHTHRSEDFATLLGAGLGGSGLEWEHINERFMDLYVTLPGYAHPMLCPGDCRYQ